MLKILSVHHYKESKEDFERRTLGKDPREIEDHQDEEFHRKKDEEK